MDCICAQGHSRVLITAKDALVGIGRVIMTDNQGVVGGTMNVLGCTTQDIQWKGSVNVKAAMTYIALSKVNGVLSNVASMSSTPAGTGTVSGKALCCTPPNV